MTYELTQHAQTVVAERKIPVAWLERVLRDPERLEPDPIDPALEHRIGRIEERGNRVLRVVVTRETSPLRVVTAFFDRRLRDAL